MYIVLEWMAWSWKSTQSKKVRDFLQKKFPEKEVILVNEPWATPIAQDIRTLAQAKTWDNDYMHPLTNAYLYAAARAQLLHTKIIPDLAMWKIIISDRCFLSSLAYQGEAQKLGFEKVMSINADAIANCIPDIVLYLSVDVDTAMSRVFDAKWDKWETMGRQFFLDTQKWYEKCAELPVVKDKFFVVDGNGEEEEVFSSIKKILESNF